ncbi:bifunctional glycosyltransferase family 2/GtrA family protein [Candidatus Kaiserbacteria bacterium]|nr:bifunctional glycosyltransferase family 2/GtrA family protein [Candidatus Kaiserbacteria bacterium]
MATKSISISVFFPIYNEKENLPSTVAIASNILSESPFVRDFEIILIDDGSSDGSAELADILSKAYKGVRVVRHRQNLGYGAALKTGISAARMEYVFFTDADLQFDIVELNGLLAHASQYPVVIGYRAPRRDPFIRLVNAWGWKTLNRLLFGLGVRDIDCAFKLFERPLIQNLQLHSKGAMISAEALIRLERLHVPIKEVPVSHLPRRLGSPTGAKPKVILRAFKEMIELYRGELGLKTHKEALRFMAVGVINTILDLAVYVVLTRFTPFFATRLVSAKFFSFLAGTISSLLLNRSWTFGVSGRLSVWEVLRFYSTVSLSIAVNVLLMNVLVGAGLYDLAALVITTVVTFIANFTLSKFWVFKNRPPAPSYPRSYAALD